MTVHSCPTCGDAGCILVSPLLHVLNWVGGVQCEINNSDNGNWFLFLSDIQSTANLNISGHFQVQQQQQKKKKKKKLFSFTSFWGVYY